MTTFTPSTAAEVLSAVHGRCRKTRRWKSSAPAPSAASAGRCRPRTRSTCRISPASRSTSRKSWCCRRRPERRSPKSRNCWRSATRNSPSSRSTTARCSAGARRRARSAACSPPICPARAGLKAGAARDHILGIQAVSGRGEAFKSGGRVVKNVTGYDLSKLMAGSWGTLAVVTDLTFKVLPAAETETTLALRGLPTRMRWKPWRSRMGSSAEVSGAAHLPEGVAASRRRRRARQRCRDAAARRRVWARRSTTASPHSRICLARPGRIDEIDDEAGLAPSGATCAIAWPLPTRSEKPVWRVSMPPSRGPPDGLALRMEAAVEAFYDWQGGLVWLRMEGAPEADSVRRLVASHGGGHATLVRASPADRAAIPVFEPQPPALAALSARLKEQFDPQGILNPGLDRPDADQSSPRPARRSACRGIGKDPAQMRALRLLHGDLSDLCDARQRARFAARAHLPDQGHAGERPAGRRARSSPISTAACPASPA